jgi:hypothetical protein
VNINGYSLAKIESHVKYPNFGGFLINYGFGVSNNRAAITKSYSEERIFLWYFAA